MTFTFLTFFSWLGLIKYMRIFRPLRSFIDMLSAILWDMRWFMTILFIGYIAVVNAFFFKLLMEGDNTPTVVVEDNISSYVKFLLSFYTYVLFADFAGQAGEISDATEWVMFFFSTIFVFLIMMNLLISIIGDTYGRLQGVKEKSAYSQLAITVHRMEGYLYWQKQFWPQFWNQPERDNQYLVFAQNVDPDSIDSNNGGGINSNIFSMEEEDPQ